MIVYRAFHSPTAKSMSESRTNQHSRAMASSVEITWVCHQWECRLGTNSSQELPNTGRTLGASSVVNGGIHSPPVHMTDLIPSTPSIDCRPLSKLSDPGSLLSTQTNKMNQIAKSSHLLNQRRRQKLQHKPGRSVKLAGAAHLAWPVRQRAKTETCHHKKHGVRDTLWGPIITHKYLVICIDAHQHKLQRRADRSIRLGR